MINPKMQNNYPMYTIFWTTPEMIDSSFIIVYNVSTVQVAHQYTSSL